MKVDIQWNKEITTLYNAKNNQHYQRLQTNCLYSRHLRRNVNLFKCLAKHVNLSNYLYIFCINFFYFWVKHKKVTKMFLVFQWYSAREPEHSKKAHKALPIMTENRHFHFSCFGIKDISWLGIHSWNFSQLWRSSVKRPAMLKIKEFILYVLQMHFSSLVLLFLLIFKCLYHPKNSIYFYQLSTSY